MSAEETDGGADRVTDPAVYDHLRASDGAPVDPGVYRVVGVRDESVTLLCVGDADGRRVTTGRVSTVDRERLAAFDPADNPDGTRSVGATVGGALDGLRWQARTFLGNLADRPLAALVALALLVVGHQGDRVLSGPDAAFTAVYFVGVFALVYAGTRSG